MSDYLPADKKSLITKNVPGYKRCQQMDFIGNVYKVLDSQGPEGCWVDTHDSESSHQTTTDIEDFIKVEFFPGNNCLLLRGILTHLPYLQIGVVSQELQSRFIMNMLEVLNDL